MIKKIFVHSVASLFSTISEVAFSSPLSLSDNNRSAISNIFRAAASICSVVVLALHTANRKKNCSCACDGTRWIWPSALIAAMRRSLSSFDDFNRFKVFYKRKEVVFCYLQTKTNQTQMWWNEQFKVWIFVNQFGKSGCEFDVLKFSKQKSIPFFDEKKPTVRWYFWIAGIPKARSTNQILIARKRRPNAICKCLKKWVIILKKNPLRFEPDSRKQPSDVHVSSRPDPRRNIWLLRLRPWT